MARVTKAYDPNQPRDDDGKWTSGGSSSLLNLSSEELDVKDKEIEAAHRDLPGYVDPRSDAALLSYVEGGYYDMNSFARKGREEYKETLKKNWRNNDKTEAWFDEQADIQEAKVSSVLGLTSPSAQGMMLYRGIDVERMPASVKAQLGSATIGSEFELSGLTSTSASPRAALKMGRAGYVFEIKAPKGTPSLITNEFESEVILSPQVKFKVTGIREIKNPYYVPGTTVIEVEAV